MYYTDAIRAIVRTQTTADLIARLRELDDQGPPRGEDNRLTRAVVMSIMMAELAKRHPHAKLDDIPHGFGHTEKFVFAAELAHMNGGCCNA